EPACVERLRQERVVLAIAALPIAAVDVDDERRIGLTGQEQIVAIAFSGPIGLIESGTRDGAIGRGRHLPARIDLNVLRYALTVVVFDLVVQHAPSPIDFIAYFATNFLTFCACGPRWETFVRPLASPARSWR